ncbi:hypothetical protein PHMEG_0005447 [Phytophthora megakarya]|uniref:Hydrogen voltage-gated channel 1 n=1 Tax=Phytophthora megakarya TaxID=4795 RepID=A0A225WRD8_9STRA|nr:hypothetical protein PHMEG_0005447 [Phytophthora megakarya]
MILLIALDVCCSALEVHLRDQQQLAVALQQLKTDGKQSASTEVAVSLLVRVVTRLVESFTGFTLFLFLIELIILLAAFRQKFFAHAGYMMDLAVVSLSLVVELYTQTKAARLLGILREQLKFLHVRMQKDAAHESLKREYESRDGIEQLLRGYKDEIVTLKEALQIAAQAVVTITENRGVDPAENRDVDTELYEHSESAIAENAFGSYPVMAGDDYSEEHMYYHQETAAVHPTELQTDLQTQYWQESEESESNHQEAAVVYPTAMSEVKEEQWQETEREDRDQDAGVNSTDMPVDSEEHCEGSESEFEDAVDS